MRRAEIRQVYRQRSDMVVERFGEHGEGYVRIALVENTQRIRQAARNIKTLFADPEKFLDRPEMRALAS